MHELRSAGNAIIVPDTSVLKIKRSNSAVRDEENTVICTN